MSDDKLHSLANKQFALETSKRIKWVITMYDQWHLCHNGINPSDRIIVDLHDLHIVNGKNLCVVLCKL